ncbi:hypothetical protein BP5796_10781 [Coleophoma crateriformis]|uniref:Uncharacterized protein n=1 Tax=Coleophoma crateriformis TaxID=565419 RepID=A0A3D8QL14_9HELO|nr:hypothetical protein BP5796_10781 [Coleophoma crateriformis]
MGLKVTISDPAEGTNDIRKRYLDRASLFFEARGNSGQLATNYEFVRAIVPRLAEPEFVQEVDVFSTEDLANVYSMENRAADLDFSYRTNQRPEGAEFKRGLMSTAE